MTVNYKIAGVEHEDKIMSYINRTSPSDSALKHALAAANKVHLTRNWPPPNFEHPVVDSFIKTLKRRPTTRTNNPIVTPVFTKRELELITTEMKANRHPTDLRNWAILILQLFGVRRANEVLCLKREDVRIHEAAFLIQIRSSETDQRGKDFNDRILTLDSVPCLAVDLPKGDVSKNP